MDANVSQNKVERYNWAKPGDKGVDKMVDLNSIKFDYSYQRHEASPQHTLAIARALNWTAFGSIICMRRANGEIFVVDGGQRVRACRRRGDIKRVPARIFESDGPEHEAQAFYATNCNRYPVRAVTKYLAQVVAQLEPQVTIDAWLRSNGFTVTDNASDSGRIDFPSLLVKTWERNVEHTKESLLIQREINGGEPMNSFVHRGIHYLLLEGIAMRPWINKIISNGGKAAILREIKRKEIELGEKAASKMSALGILEIINKGCRHRIRLG